jgi:hypothetical protein
MMICPKCSQPAMPDRAAIADETVYECTKCDLYTVEGSTKWVRGGPYLIGALRFLAESRDESVKGS